MVEGFDLFAEIKNDRLFEELKNKDGDIETIEEALGMTLEEAKQLHKDQLDMHKKYPDASEYDCWSEGEWDKPEFEERCPFCHKEMCLAIQEGGPWDLFGLGTLGGDAIGQGRHHSSYDYEGYSCGYYQIYYKCPKCGKVFYIEYES